MHSCCFVIDHIMYMQSEEADLRKMVSEYFLRRLLKTIHLMRRQITDIRRAGHIAKYAFVSTLLLLPPPRRRQERDSDGSLMGRGGCVMDRTEFPDMPGAYFRMNDPPLEFVKMLCHVFALEPAVEFQVALLRRVRQCRG